ncbi:MAG: pyroglutamyl-peptidase I, partial [Planctomycetota bacterium]
MTRLLLTAFEPYADWSDNASWLVIERLTRDLPVDPQITTRLYPVAFSAMRERLETDLSDES